MGVSFERVLLFLPSGAFQFLDLDSFQSATHNEKQPDVAAIGLTTSLGVVKILSKRAASWRLQRHARAWRLKHRRPDFILILVL
jgi:hypothetical protein